MCHGKLGRQAGVRKSLSQASVRHWHGWLPKVVTRCLGIHVARLCNPPLLAPQIIAVEVRRYREDMVVEIESWAADFKESGLRCKWLEGADPATRQVAQGVNGPLMEKLIDLTAHVDTSCPQLFRKGSWPCSGLACIISLVVPVPWPGAMLFGNLERSGIGCAIDVDSVQPPPSSVEDCCRLAALSGVRGCAPVFATCCRHNLELLGTLQADDFQNELWQQTLRDAELGRMSAPIPGAAAHTWRVQASLVHACAAYGCDLSRVRLHPRFAVDQGLRHGFCCMCAWAV